MEIKFAMINQHCPNALIENGLHIVCICIYVGPISKMTLIKRHLSMLGRNKALQMTINNQLITITIFKVIWYGMDLCVGKLKYNQLPTVFYVSSHEHLGSLFSDDLKCSIYIDNKCKPCL